MKALVWNEDRLLRVVSATPQFLSVVLFGASCTESREEQHHGAPRRGRGVHADEGVNQDRLLRAVSATPQFLSAVLFAAGCTESREEQHHGAARMGRGVYTDEGFDLE